MTKVCVAKVNVDHTHIHILLFLYIYIYIDLQLVTKKLKDILQITFNLKSIRAESKQKCILKVVLRHWDKNLN